MWQASVFKTLSLRRSSKFNLSCDFKNSGLQKFHICVRNRRIQSKIHLHDVTKHGQEYEGIYEVVDGEAPISILGIMHIDEGLNDQQESSSHLFAKVRENAMPWYQYIHLFPSTT